MQSASFPTSFVPHNLLQSIWARRPRRLGSEVWNLQPGLVHVKFSPPMLRLVWVDHGRIVSVKIFMRNGNAERSAFAIIHRQRKRGAARGDEVRPSRSHHQALSRNDFARRAHRCEIVALPASQPAQRRPAPRRAPSLLTPSRHECKLRGTLDVPRHEPCPGLAAKFSASARGTRL